MQTVDFEYVLSVLNQVKINQSIAEIFSEQATISDKLKKQIDDIKGLLADSVLTIHPRNQYESIKHNSYVECAKFLNIFNHIYSLNYDLLLYWAHMNNNDLRKNLKDGFWDKIAEKSYFDLNFENNLWPNCKAILYLHGGLHLFLHSATSRLPYKIICKDGNSLLYEIKKEIQTGKLPLCITEGAPELKLDKIYQNEYLSSCYSSFSNSEGVLVTYGVSFTNDSHILSAIKNNEKIKSVYVGIHKKNYEPFEKVKTLLNSTNKKVWCYNSDQTHPWGRQKMSAYREYL